MERLDVISGLESGVSDAARAREVYKYYQPSSTACLSIEPSLEAHPGDDPDSYNTIDINSNVSSTKISSPDTALTAFAQLVSWRTGCQRAMISIVDRETQYFIAESTKSIDLIDNTNHAPGDGLWMGCSEVAKAGRLCERTIELPPSDDGEFRAFIVPDLSADPRFESLSFVKGPPFLKFYAGTPLISKRGIPIGSLFVVDDRARPQGFEKEVIHFMGTMAQTIMRHMEMTREVEEHRRGMKMSRGLASFVEGRSQLEEAEVDLEDEGNSVVGEFRSSGVAPIAKSKAELRQRTPRASKKASVSSVSSVERREREYSNALNKQEENIMRTGPQILSPAQHDSPGAAEASVASGHSRASLDTFTTSIDSQSAGKLATSPESPDLSEASTQKHLFSRAANLIREAFEVDGGSLFVDAQIRFNNDFSAEPVSESKPSPADLPSSGGEGSASDIHEFSRFANINTAHRGSIFSSSTLDHRQPVEVLGFSTPQAASIHGDEPPGPSSFIPLGERTLHTLLRRYPRGKLWIFDEGGPATSSSEEDNTKPGINGDSQWSAAKLQKKRARIMSEARILLLHFPGVRQLMFVPLWDASRNRWLAGNFTWTNEPTRILSKQGELAFLTGFGNSVMAECSRLDTEMADEKKTAFIGSISHELRSPLHGILASAEFLGEELTEGFSKGLVETIDSCGRTLLDTINHILDFSKINHFEKNWRRSRRRNSTTSRAGPGAGIGNKSSGTVALRQADLPMINLFADVDVSVVCEEVVEGVFAGYVFQNVTAPTFDMVADSRGKMSDKKWLATGATIGNADAYHHPEVAVIFDVDIRNYNFITQPGAFRRVVMNLLGNALKYTSRGYVKVKLEAAEMEDFRPPGTTEMIPRSCVTLSITDTGKGISNEFIRSKLFLPFAQENSLSSGTGLGLSIVRSIVSLLEGEIQIKSEVGRGTEVKVILPLLRELPKDASSGSTPKSNASAPASRDADEIIERLRQRVIGKSAALQGFDVTFIDPLASQANQLLKASIANFLVKWYGLSVVQIDEMPDIIVANEPAPDLVDKLAKAPPGRKHGPLVLSLCSHSTRFERMQANTSNNAKIGFLAKPIGPLKLAKALSQCLDGVPLLPTPGVPQPLSSAAMAGLPPSNRDLVNVFEELSLSQNGGEVLDNSRMAAGSLNARKALESPTPLASETFKEFPFPADDAPLIPRTKSMPADRQSLLLVSGQAPPTTDIPARASVVLAEMEKTAHLDTTAKPTKVATVQDSSLSSPKLLLVDDNKINLRLLRTYMRKRQYEHIDEAENGLEAVQSFESCPSGYDVIFMDISMPVLDGFGATRQIRKLEMSRREKNLAAGRSPDTPALIIALTGLASSKDQAEAFKSGVDLFLTKPVAFKEVGKMLDNWQANRERDCKSDGEAVKSAKELKAVLKQLEVRQREPGLDLAAKPWKQEATGRKSPASTSSSLNST